MLSKEDNDLLTRTGPGTAAGNLLRRYWQPVALSEELPPDGPPVPVRILGEDLVLFRDEQNRIGLLGIHCSHRGADLSYGRLEDGGLRCIYHGWLYDVTGRCLEQPGEPPGSTFAEKILHRAYPCQEAGGFILAYMGGGEPPLLTAFEFLATAEDHRVTTKELRECNYLQSNEGNFDPQHLGMLHRTASTPSNRYSSFNLGTLETEETDFGVRLYTVVPIGDDEVSVSLHNFIMPNLSAFGAGSREGYGVNWCVPIDDTHSWVFRTLFDRERIADPGAVLAGRASMASGFQRTRNFGNRYLQDREEMKSFSYAGMGTNFADQDACVTEGMGPIYDRTQEHLGACDKAIVAARAMLLRAVRVVQAGQEPPNVVRDPARNHPPQIVARGGDVLPKSADWHTYWKQYAPSAD